MPGQNARFYHVVDVFTERVLEGNALAVFPQGTEFADDVMQKIARELNLSETVFVLPSTRPDCAARLRIFTPFYELMFAGHPTVGTSFVLLAEGIVPPGTERFLLEEGVGPVPVRVESGARPLIWLTTPPIEYGPLFDRDAAAEALGLAVNELLDIPPQLVSAGNPFIFVALRNREAVDRAALDKTGMRKFNTQHLAASGVFVFAPTTEGAYSRMFAPDHGIIEDPATGSATGPLAAYMLRHNLVSGADGHRFISEQGTKMGRRSILHVRLEGQNGEHAIEVGGCVTPFASGVLT
ncbi:MAG TPA: PhzF family phenazine biosynthesis protein [Bryobacteraceae bacterium]